MHTVEATCLRYRTGALTEMCQNRSAPRIQWKFESKRRFFPALCVRARSASRYFEFFAGTVYTVLRDDSYVNKSSFF
jgi:hypothetical protein